MQPHERQKSCLRWIYDNLGNNNGSTCGRMNGTFSFLVSHPAAMIKVQGAATASGDSHLVHDRLFMSITGTLLTYAGKIEPPPPTQAGVLYETMKDRENKMCINVDV